MNQLVNNNNSGVIPVNAGIIQVYDQGLFYAYEDEVNRFYKLFDGKIRAGFKDVSGLVYNEKEPSSIYIIGSNSSEEIAQHRQMLKRGEKYLLKNMEETYCDRNIELIGNLCLIEQRLIALTFPMKYTARQVSSNTVSRERFGHLMEDNRENDYFMFPRLMFQETPTTETIISEVSDFVDSMPATIRPDIEKRNFRCSAEQLYNKYIVGTEYEDPSKTRAKILKATQQELTALAKYKN